MASTSTGQGEAGPQSPAVAEFDAKSLAKSLLRAVPAGALGTLDANGAPFSTLVTVATDVDGRPLLLLSRLAAHTGHLERDPRASLLLARLGRGDPLAHPRLTLSARAERLERESEDGQRARRRFLACQPKAALYADFGDFAFWRLGVSDAHLNGGFARAARLSAAELLTDIGGAEDLISAEEAALAHMNSDHAEAVSLYATVLLGAAPGPWRLTGLDPEGCDLALAEERRRLAFPRPVRTPDELRAVLVGLAQDARAKAAHAKEADATQAEA
jgi:putative heme iron utilization protein